MPEQDFDKNAVVALLNRILEDELAGVVRYTHYSLMVFGHSRIPIISWLREQAATGPCRTEKIMRSRPAMRSRAGNAAAKPRSTQSFDKEVGNEPI